MAPGNASIANSYSVASNDARSEMAKALLAAGGVVSVQVFNEFAATARRKLGMSWDGHRRGARRGLRDALHGGSPDGQVIEERLTIRRPFKTVEGDRPCRRGRFDSCLRSSLQPTASAEPLDCDGSEPGRIVPARAEPKASRGVPGVS